MTKIMALIAATFTAGVVMAQQVPEQPAQPPQAVPEAPPAPQVNEAQIENAVTAYVAVNAIQERVQQQLAGVEDQEQIQATVMQARQDMVEAVQEAGLQPQEYEQIILAVNQNEEVRNTFLRLLQAHQGG